MITFILFSHMVLLITADQNADEILWKEFKKNHSKTYKSSEEENFRRAIFSLNLRTIENHNSAYNNGTETYFLGINQFADLSSEEFENTYLSYKIDDNEVTDSIEYTPNLTIPASIDWRSRGAVLAVRNQGSCGSCWAFSAISSLESQIFIKHKRKVALSEQELIDCSGGYSNHGCKGGLMDSAFRYMKARGISSRASYPYRATNGRCQKKARAGVKVTGFRDVPRNERALQRSVASVGPIAVAVNANLFRFYKGGILDNKNCGKALNHGVVVVGYGTIKNNHAFWIVKNSWGTNWGEHGYIRMARNKNNQCGIASRPSYPTIS